MNHIFSREVSVIPYLILHLFFRESINKYFRTGQFDLIDSFISKLSQDVEKSATMKFPFRMIPISRPVSEIQIFKTLIL